MSAIVPQKVLHDLAGLWAGIDRQAGDGSETAGDSSTGVLRACTMTLVVLLDDQPGVESAAAEQYAGEAIALLMREHPSRTIVVHLRPSGDPSLEARVSAQCWMPFGKTQQICCEQIDITATEAALGDVPGVVLPLAAPDLPLVVWCRPIRLFGLPAFAGFYPLAGKVILDSGDCPDAAAALTNLASAIASGKRVCDLAWTRLTRRRELIAQIFENPVYLSQVSTITGVKIRSTGSAIPVSAYYLAAWLRQCLESAGAHPTLEFVSEGGAGRGELAVVEINGRNQVEVELVEGAVFEARVDGLAHRTSLPAFTDHALLREELGLMGRDPVYEATVGLAAKLASGLEPGAR